MPTRSAVVRPAYRRRARCRAPVASTIDMVASLLPLAACSGDEDGAGGTAPPPGEIEDLGDPGVPEEWRQGSCEARAAASAAEAVELMGEPTRESAAGARTELVWRVGQDVLLSLTVGEDGTVVGYGSSVAESVPEDVRTDLRCASRPGGS